MSIGLNPDRNVPGDTIDQYRAGLGEYLGAVADDAWQTGPFMSITRLGLTSAYQLEAEAGQGRLLAPAEANQQGKALGLTFNEPIAQGAYNVIAGEKQRQIADQQTFQRARLQEGYGTLRWLLAGGTEFLMQAVDPINIAASFIPVVPEARFASLAARIGEVGATLTRGAIEGAVGQAVLEPITALERRQQGEEYRLLDTVLDLTFGAGLGVVLHGAHYGAGAGFRFVRDRYILGEPKAPKTLLTSPVTPSGERITPTDVAPFGEPTVETRDSPPPRQPVAEAMEGLNEATKQTALRAAVAQLAQDKPVDIEPILKADPAWPQVQADMQAHLALQRQATAEAAPAPWTVPADFAPTGPQLAEAQRLRRGWTPEPKIAEPLSLSEYVRRRGGLKEGTPEAGDLLAADLEKGTARALVREGGRDIERLAQAAFEEGYPVPRSAVGSGVDVEGFIKALGADATGGKRMLPDDSATAAFTQQQEYFDQVAQSIRELGVDPTQMEPRRLAYLLSRDPDHGRLLSLLDRLDRVDEKTSAELAHRLDQEAAEMQAGILREETEPGAHEEDTMVDHREFPAATLQDVERFYELERRAVSEDTGGRPALEPVDPFGRPAEDRQAPPARPGASEPAAEAAGLRPAERAEGAAAANQGTPDDLGNFAERQAKADLHADTEALGREDQRLASAAPELEKMLREDLERYAPILDDSDKAAIAAIEKEATEAEQAISALATCRMGGP